MKKDLKVVVIGAASPQWGMTLARDLIVTLSDEKIYSSYKPTVVLEDIDGVNLEHQRSLANTISQKIGNKVTITSTTDQKKALEGAQFVVVSFAVGSLEAMQYDIEIPQDYGIYQPVGDTISIGGAIRAVRNIPALLNIAQDMENLSAPNPYLLNLSNPMSLLCRAVTRETKVCTIGLCHELYGGLYWLTKTLDLDYENWRDDYQFDVLGVNHCGWLQYIRKENTDILQLLRDYLQKEGITSETKKLYDSNTPELTRDNVRINLFLRYGVLPISGDRHTSEFFSEFINQSTNKGADLGVLLTTAQERLVVWRGEARKRVNALLKGENELDLNVSQEAASKIIRSILLDEPFYDVGNIPYHGNELPGVPTGAVLERMVTYTQNSITPNPINQPLPPDLHNHLVLITTIIDEIVKASVNGNRKLLIRALEKDPLLQNMPKQKIPEMVDRLLRVHRQWVHPGFF